MEHVDVVIVGAGLHGLAVARTLVATSPVGKKIAIFDEAATVGGSWAAERLYPGLKTNNVVGSYEFSDFPMNPKHYGLEAGQHIPGAVVHRYLADFARHFGLDKLARLRTKVEAAFHRDDGSWQLEYTCFASDVTVTGTLTCAKLVIATGLTSEARIPVVPGSSEFLGPMFHAKELHKRAKDLQGCDEVVVIGGNKSSWDACYFVAKSGARAHMVIRKSGGGPSWVWRPFHLLGVRLTLARLSSTRLSTWLDPSPFGSQFLIARRLLHETIPGRLVTRGCWAVLDFLAAKATGYHDPLLRMLRPWTSTYWMGNSLSIHNYETNWFDLVKQGRIIVHHADVTTLKPTEVHLSDGNCLRADALVFCTGWECAPPIKFKPEEVAADIGLPRRTLAGHAEPFKSESAFAMSNELSEQQDQDMRFQVKTLIKARYPSLRSPPERTLPEWDSVGTARSRLALATEATARPYELYRFMVPSTARFVKERSLAFIGMHRAIHAVVVAQAQALWLAAYLDNRLPLAADSVRHETLVHTEYERLRRPRESGGSGGSFPDLVFDSIPYTDLLLEDVGVRAVRKRGVWANLMEPHLPADYKGLIEEWLSTQEGAERNSS